METAFQLKTQRSMTFEFEKEWSRETTAMRIRGKIIRRIELSSGEIIPIHHYQSIQGVEVDHRRDPSRPVMVQKIVISDQAPLPMVLHGIETDIKDPLEGFYPRYGEEKPFFIRLSA